MLDFALSEDLDTLFVAQLLHNDDKEVGKILADPDTHISLSDAGAHLTFFCDAGFGLHLLGHWSRDLGVLDLPQAVHRLTGQPASCSASRAAACSSEGYAADLMLFDPDDRGARPQAPGARPARRRGAAHDRRGRPAWHLDQRRTGGRRQRLLRRSREPSGEVLRSFAA